MTTGSHTHRTRPTVIRKPDKYIFEWAPRIQQYITEVDWQCELRGDKKPEYFKIKIIVDWLDERYSKFRTFKPLFKKILVGKCMTHCGHEKYTRGDQGWVYRRRD